MKLCRSDNHYITPPTSIEITPAHQYQMSLARLASFSTFAEDSPRFKVIPEVAGNQNKNHYQIYQYTEYSPLK